MKLSKRAMALEPSATLATVAKVNELRANGIQVLSLTLGEPDFVTPLNIQEAAVQAIHSGKASFYTTASGIPELKQAIIQRTKEDYGITYEKNEVGVTTGAKFALYTLFQALIDEGDDVIIPTPYWVSYGEQVKLAKGHPVFVAGEISNNLKVTVAQLEAARTDKTKMLVLNTPSNPSGAIYDATELKEIGDWAVKHNIYIIADDIYGKLVFNGNRFTPIATLSPEIKKQTLVVNGVSKAYSMTGWRIGYVLGDSEIIGAVNSIISQSTSNCTTVSQYAAIEALTGPQGTVEEMRLAFEGRLNTIYPLVSQLPGFKLGKPQGAFYLFPNIKETLSICGYKDVSSWVSDLLSEEQVAVVDGAAFGAPDHIRLSYATDIETIKQAIKKIALFIERKSQKK